MKKLIADFAEYDRIEIKNGDNFIEWTAEEFEKHMAWVEQEVIKDIKNTGVRIYAKHVEDEEIAKHMDTLVRFKLEQMLTAVEDLRLEREAHQALRQQISKTCRFYPDYPVFQCNSCKALPSCRESKIAKAEVK